MEKEIEDKDKIKNAINKTGFVLENKIISQLEKAGWSTINNRYYIDDVTRAPREIDILAYRVSKYEDILFYTSLIISCKKSSEHQWIFLTRKVKREDPNIELCPIEYWTNSGILKNMRTYEKIQDTIFKRIDTNTVYKIVYGIESNVFAFQEIDLPSAKPKNDKNIYNSIISTIKAMEYEKNALANRKKQATQYFFHLLTVVEGDTFEIDYSKNEEITKSDHIKYLNRFIINNKDAFHLVHFINANKFSEILRYFKIIHDEMFGEHIKYINIFKKQFLTDYSKRNLFKDKVSEELIPKIQNKIFWEYGYDWVEIEEITLSTDKLSDSLYLKLQIDEKYHDIIEKLNSDSEMINLAKKIIQKWYKYDGKLAFGVYEIDDDLPF